MSERRGRTRTARAVSGDAEVEKAAEETAEAVVEAIVEEEMAAEKSAEASAKKPEGKPEKTSVKEPEKMPETPTRESPEEAVRRLLDRPRPRDRPSSVVRFKRGPETVVVFVDLPSTLVEEMWRVWRDAGRDQTSLMALLAGSVSVKYVRYVKEVTLG